LALLAARYVIREQVPGCTARAASLDHLGIEVTVARDHVEIVAELGVPHHSLHERVREHHRNGELLPGQAVRSAGVEDLLGGVEQGGERA
jgi:hypothetical protein